MTQRDDHEGCRAATEGALDGGLPVFSRRRTPFQTAAERVPLGCTPPPGVATMPLATVLDAILCLDLYAAAAPRPHLLAVRDGLARLQAAVEAVEPGDGGDPATAIPALAAALGHRLAGAVEDGGTPWAPALALARRAVDAAAPADAFGAAVAAFEAAAPALLPPTPTPPMVNAAAAAADLSEDQVRRAYAAMAAVFMGR